MTKPPPRPESDFYVGYLDRAPVATARFVGRVVFSIVIGGLVLAVLLAGGQSRLEPATYEFGVERDFAGHLHAMPYPMLAVSRPGTPAGDQGVSWLSLVGEGKHGVDSAVTAAEGRAVSISGSLIYRDETAMIEVMGGAVRAAPARERAPSLLVEDLGSITLHGEIVDSKCFLGVMNPGSWTVHRACAVRCISGGIPPAFVVRDSEGPAAFLWLTSADGTALSDEVLDFVAEPLEITGRLIMFGDHLVLQSDPNSYRRLP